MAEDARDQAARHAERYSLTMLEIIGIAIVLLGFVIGLVGGTEWSVRENRLRRNFDPEDPYPFD